MRVRRWPFICLMLFVTVLSRLESATVYTDQTSFLNAVQSGYYLESFDSLPQPFVLPPLLFSPNGFSSTADTQDDLFFTAGGALSTDHDAFDIPFDLTSNNVTA